MSICNRIIVISCLSSSVNSSKNDKEVNVPYSEQVRNDNNLRSYFFNKKSVTSDHIEELAIRKPLQYVQCFHQDKRLQIQNKIKTHINILFITCVNGKFVIIWNAKRNCTYRKNITACFHDSRDDALICEELIVRTHHLEGTGPFRNFLS